MPSDLYGEGRTFPHTIFTEKSIYGRWLRFAGEGGDVLTTHPPPTRNYCGTWQPLWLSGWNPDDGVPPLDYDIPGTLPTAAEGVKPMTVRYKQHAAVCT